jgi:tetratricopeptide (TPR) repeat protein
MELDFSDVTDQRSCVFEERLQAAEDLRTRGNDFYRTGDFFNAGDCYHRALYQVDFEEMSWNFELLDSHRDSVLEIKLPLCLNAAAVRLKDNEFSSAVKLADAVLKEQPNHPKALFRKASALMQLKKFDEALAVAKKAARLSPGDQSITVLLTALKKQVQRDNRRYKQVIQKAFRVKRRRVGLSSLLSIRSPLNLFYWVT